MAGFQFCGTAANRGCIWSPWGASFHRASESVSPGLPATSRVPSLRRGSFRWESCGCLRGGSSEYIRENGSNLVLDDGVFVPPLELVLEPGVGHAQVDVGLGLDGRVAPQEDLPVVVDVLQHGRESHVQQRQVFEGLSVPKYLHLLALRTGVSIITS